MILNEKRRSRNTLDLVFDCTWEAGIYCGTTTTTSMLHLWQFVFRIAHFVVCLNSFPMAPEHADTIFYSKFCSRFENPWTFNFFRTAYFQKRRYASHVENFPLKVFYQLNRLAASCELWSREQINSFISCDIFWTKYSVNIKIVRKNPYM